MGLFLHRSGFIGGAAPESGGGGGDETVLNPWVDRGTIATGTYRQNTGSDDRFVIATIDSIVGDLVIAQQWSTDGATLGGSYGHRRTNFGQTDVFLNFPNVASEYSRININVGTGSASVPHWWTQEIDGAAGSWESMMPRSLSTSYQNTSGYDRLSMINLGGNNSSPTSVFQLQISPDNSAWTVVCDDRTQTNKNASQFFGVVPNGYYARVVRATGANSIAAIASWHEKELDRVTGGAEDKTASRALATSYQNTKSIPIIVQAATAGNNDGGLSTFTLQSSPNNSTWSKVNAAHTYDAHNYAMVIGEIPAGYYYRFLKTSGSNTAYSLEFWLEQNGS